MRHPDITKPPVAPSGCDECLAPNGRHEWHCSEVPADLFIAALNAPRPRRPLTRTLRRQRPRIVAAVALVLALVELLTGAWWLGLVVFVLLMLASAGFVRRAK